jgi:hypothetical protein
MLQKIPGVEIRLQKIVFKSVKIEAATFIEVQDRVGDAVKALLPHDR